MTVYVNICICGQTLRFITAAALRTQPSLRIGEENSKQSTEKGKEKRGKSWRSVLGASHRAKAIFSSTEPIPQRLKSERLTKLIHNAKLLHSVIQHKAPAGSNLDRRSENSISKQQWDMNAVSGRIILTGNEGSLSL